MTILIGQQNKSSTPYYQRKIRCPGHWLVPPTVDVYLREPVDLLKDCSDYAEVKGKRIKIKKTRIVKDKWGNKQLDWKKLYELRSKGIVINPVITASEAIERIYDPLSMLCLNCDKRCLEGKGRINERSIRRLSGG